MADSLKNVKAYCPAIKQMVNVQGEITLLINGLEQLTIKHCSHNDDDCPDHNPHHKLCLLGKNLQTGRW